MGFEQIDEACQAGARAENSDFAAPSGTAGINPLKVTKRTLKIPFHITSGGIVTSGGITLAGSGLFGCATFQNASAGYILVQASAPRGEISPGSSAILKVAWAVGGVTAGNVRFVADLKPAINGISALTSALTRNVIQAADGVTAQIMVAKMEIPPAILNNNQLWGLKLARDPINALDTLAADVIVLGIWMEISGRC